MLFIKSILNKVDDWPSFQTQVRVKFLHVIYGEHVDDAECEPPKEEVLEQNQFKEIATADGGEVSEDLQKTNDLNGECEEVETPELIDDDEVMLEDHEGEKAKGELISQLVEVCDDIMRAPKILIDLLNKFKEQCYKLEEESHKLEEEKNELVRQLYAATESLEHYRENELKYAEHQRMWNREKDDLVNTHYRVQTSDHDIVNDNGFEDHRKWKKRNHINDPAASASPAAFYGKGFNDYLAGLGAVCNAGAPGVIPTSHDYQKMYQNAVNELDAKRLEWEEENKDLLAKLSATNSWYQHYVLVTYDYQLQNHNLLVERNDLSVQLQAANTSAELYKTCYEESDDECRKLEEEKNELVAKVCAAKAASELYRSYLHDVSS